MAIVGLDQVGSQGGQTSTAKSQSLGKSDFLHLLVTQLQNQDPLNPADSTEFTAQLATFSSLEELQNISETLKGVSTSQSILTNSQAVDYIGKRITAKGDQINIENGQPDPAVFNLDGNATSVYLKIYDQYGDFVQDLALGPMGAGEQRADWDGLNHNGGPAPDGPYRYQVMAVDGEANEVGATTFTAGTVTGVNYKNSLAYLVTKFNEVALGNVVQVIEP
jgi:flagellar basal-body rod modification protein FlgD